MGIINRSISKAWFLIWLMVIFAAGLFIYIATEIVLKNNIGFDAYVINYVRAHETQALIEFMIVCTFFGSAQFLLPAYIILIVFYLLKKNKSYALDIALTGSCSTIIMFMLKNIFKRHRPSIPLIKSIVGYSFPSGHSLSSFVFCSLLAYLIFQTTLKNAVKYIITFCLLLTTFTIGLSRIVLNVHYPSDVLAGFCLGFVLVVIAFCLMNKERDKNEERIIAEKKKQQTI